MGALRSCVLSIAIVSTSLGFAAPPAENLAGSSHALSANSRKTISEIEVNSSAEAVTVRITANAPVSPRTTTLTDPDRLVIDFPGFIFSKQYQRIRVLRPPIMAVRAATNQSNPPMARVVVDLAAPLTHHFEAHGSDVVVTFSVPKQGFAPTAAPKSGVRKADATAPREGIGSKASDPAKTRPSLSASIATNSAIGNVQKEERSIAPSRPREPAREAMKAGYSCDAIRMSPLETDFGGASRLNQGAGAFDEAKLEVNRQAAERGDAAVEYQLGVAYRDAGRGAEDRAEAVRWFRRAAEHGNAQGQYSLAVSFAFGDGSNRDPAEALKWFRQAAGQGLADAQYALGNSYILGKLGAKDDSEAAAWYRRAAAQGHRAAQANLGLLYACGRGVSRNDAEAVHWFRAAAEQGDAGAENNLGLMYLNGYGITRDDQLAAAWLARAAEQGSVEAQYTLGVSYLRGRAVAIDEVRAMQWLHKAAGAGFLPAQLSLAELLTAGVATNAPEAINWLQQAAEHGSAEGQYKLAHIYEEGRLVPAAPQKASLWYQMAAEQNNAAAQNALGLMYQEGRGVPRDYVMAYMWFTLAAAGGEDSSKNAMNLIAPKLTMSQLAEAQRRALSWTAQYKEAQK